MAQLRSLIQLGPYWQLMVQFLQTYVIPYVIVLAIAFLSVAFAFFIVGVIVTVSHRFTHHALLNLLMRLLLLTSLLVFLPSWGNTLQTLLQNSVLSGLGIDPAQVYQQFNQLLVIKRDPSMPSSW